MVSQVSRGSLPVIPRNFNKCAETPAEKARRKRRTQISRKDNRSPGQEKGLTEMECGGISLPSSDRGVIIEKMPRQKKLASATKITTDSLTKQCAPHSTVYYTSYASSQHSPPTNLCEQKLERTEMTTSLTVNAASTSLVEGLKKTEKKKKKQKRASQIVSGDGSAGRVGVENGETREKNTSRAQSKTKEKRKTSIVPTNIDENVSPVLANEQAIEGDVMNEPKQESKKKIRVTAPMEWIGGDEFDVHSTSDISCTISPSRRRKKESMDLKARTKETALLPETKEHHDVCIDAAVPPHSDQGDVPVQSTAGGYGDSIDGDYVSDGSAYFINGDDKRKDSRETLEHFNQRIDVHIPRSLPIEVVKKKRHAKKKKLQSTFQDKHSLPSGVEEKRALSEEKKLNSTFPEIPAPVSSSELKPLKKKIKKVSKKSDGTTSHPSDESTLHSGHVKQGGSKATLSEVASLNATTRPLTASNKKISNVVPLVMEAQDSSSVVTHSDERTSHSISVNGHATLPKSNPSNRSSTDFTSHKIEAPAFSSSPKVGGRRIAVANYAKQRVSQSQEQKRVEEGGPATTPPSTVEKNSDAAGVSPAKGETIGLVCGKDSSGTPESPTTTHSSHTSGLPSSRELFQHGVGRPPLIHQVVVGSKHERRISSWHSSVHQSKSNYSSTAFSVLSKTRSTRSMSSKHSLLSWNPVTSVKQMLKKRPSESAIATDVEVPMTVWYVRPETALMGVDGRQRVMNMTFYDTYTDASFKD